MVTRKKLQHSSLPLLLQRIRKIRSKLLPLKGIPLDEPIHHFFILAGIHRTGTVQQNPAGLHIPPDHIQKLSLQFFQLLQGFSGDPVLNVPLFPDHAKSRAGQIRQHNIRLLKHAFIRRGGVINLNLYIGIAHPLYIISHLGYLILRYVPGNNLSTP